MEIGNLPEKVFRVIITKVIKNLGEQVYRVRNQTFFLTKELENIKNHQE